MVPCIHRGAAHVVVAFHRTGKVQFERAKVMADDVTPSGNTPETEDVKKTTTEVEHTTEHAAAPSAQGEDVKDRVSNLEGVVNGLIEKVEHLTPNPADKTPTDVPWTHKGGRTS